ncbi:unnamed protein product, partial [marine sediment metagenome]
TWEYKESGSGNRVVSSKYPTMNIEDIKDLPIRNISNDTCILWLWVTFPRLEQGLEVIKAWSFKYYGLGFVWAKTTKEDNYAWGMGYYTRQNPEVCLIGVKQNRIKPQVRNILSIFRHPRMEHSRKPAMVRDKIVDICGDLPRIELFARPPKDLLFEDESYKGWDLWGNEV